MDDGTLHSDFYVSPIEGLEAEASPVTPVTHIAFLADNSQQAVQAFHAVMRCRRQPGDNGAPVRARTIPAITPHSCWTRMAITSKPSWIGLIRTTSKTYPYHCLRRHRAA